MDPQFWLVLGRVAVASPWVAVIIVVVLNLHRITEAWESVTRTRLRNVAAKQALNGNVHENSRKYALDVLKELEPGTRARSGISQPGERGQRRRRSDARRSTQRRLSG